MPDLPSGTVTFLMTDVEGSTVLLRDHCDEMLDALRQHDAIVERAVGGNHGHVVKSRGEGDSVFAVFVSAADAARAAFDLQRGVNETVWSANAPIRLRIAVDCGEAYPADGDYRAIAVNRCARLRAAARGGQVLLSAPVYDLAHSSLPAGAKLRDHGLIDLRDFPNERIYELVLPWQSEPFPPLRTAASRRHALPVQLTSFIGRERELTELRDQIASARLVTLVGPGGCGKTRLAVEALLGMPADQPGSTWFADLSALSDPALVPQAVAGVLDVREQAGQALTDAICESTRELEGILVLDNCEQVRAAASALAAGLLSCAPGFRILATSRTSLGVAGEVVWHVPPLSVPQAGGPDTAERIDRFEATRLFADRAARVYQKFAVTDVNAPAIAELCRELDGIPLAIELAAARSRVLAPHEILSHLKESMSVLAGSVPDVPVRHRTLVATLDWSYNLLPELDQKLLRRLSVFAGGFTLEGASAVCAGDDIAAADVLDLLSTLDDSSLLLVNEGQRSTRYGLLDTIRVYAGKLLDERHETPELRHRHLAYFVELAKMASAELQGPSQAEWLDRLDAELSNLRVALEWAVQTFDDSGAALAAALSQFWFTRGHHREALATIRSVLEVTSARDAVRAKLLNTAGVLACSAGDCEKALELHQAALSISLEIDDRLGAAAALINSGRTAFRQGDLLAATDHYLDALAVYEELGHDHGIATALIGLGGFAMVQREYDRSAEYLERSLPILQRVGNRRLEASALHNLGEIARRRKELKRARDLFSRAIEIARQLNDRPTAADALDSQARVAAARNDCARAVRLSAAADRLRTELGTALSSEDQLEDEQGLRHCRKRLGDQAYSVAWETGARMSLAEVYDDALQK